MPPYQLTLPFHLFDDMATDLDPVQYVPAPVHLRRVETGPVQFGGDWPGVFIRGDSALMLYAPLLDQVVKFLKDQGRADTGSIAHLAELLRSCQA